MVLVGEEELVVLHAGLVEGLHQLHSVLEVHVVVGGAVNEEVFALEVLGVSGRRVEVVAVGVLLRRAHKALGVDVVVVAPVGDRCHGDGHLEGAVAAEEREGGEVAAEAPAPDADAVAVHVGLLFEPVGGGNLVDGLIFAHLLVDDLLEGVAPGGGAAPVHAHGDVAVLRQHLVEGEVLRAAVGVHHLLAARTAVAVHHHRITLVGVEVGGLHHPAVQFGAVLRGEVDNLAVHKTVFVHRLLHVLVVVQHAQLLAALFVDGVFGQGVQVGVLEAVVVAVRAEFRARPTVAFGQKLFLLAIEVDDIEVAVEHTGFVREVIDEFLFLVHILDFIHFPIAVGQLLDFSAKRHFVDVVEAVALGGDNHRVVVGEEVVVVGHVQPFVVLVGIDNVLLSGGGVVADEVKPVLMAVELEDDGVLAVGHPIDAREVAVAVVAQIHLGETLGGDVVDIDVHQGVVLAGLGVFVLEVGGVELIVEGEVVLLDAAFVEAQEGDLGAVGRPGGGARHIEFLLIHPVGVAVEDGVGLAVAGDLGDLAGGELLVEEVAVAGEEHLGAVLGEHGEVQFGVGVGHQGERLGGDVIDVVEGERGAAPDALLVDGQHNLRLVGGELIAADLADIDRAAAETLQIRVGEEHIDELAGGEAVALNAAALHHGVAVTLGHCGVAGHPAGIEIKVVPDFFNGDFLGLAEGDDREGQHKEGK